MRLTIKKNTFSKKGIIVDTKPFVLYVIGSLDSSYVERFSSTKEFTRENFDALQLFLSEFKHIYVTDYIISEFSHFTLEEKSLRGDYKEKIANLILALNKRQSISAQSPDLSKIFSNKHITKVGASDASILEIELGREIAILTSDGPLADIVRKRYDRPAFKFLPQLGLVSY